MPNLFMQLNNAVYPAVVTPGTGGTTTFTATVPAPAIPSSVSGSAYPVTVNYTPDPTFAAPVPPYSFPLSVGPATTVVTQTVTPSNPMVNTNLTVAGTIASSNGLPPSGTLTITVSTGRPMVAPSRLSDLCFIDLRLACRPATQLTACLGGRRASLRCKALHLV